MEKCRPAAVDNLDSQTRHRTQYLEPVKEEAAIRSVGWGSVSDSLGPEDKKNRGRWKINDLRYYCVQDEDTIMLFNGWWISMMIYDYVEIQVFSELTING